MARTAYALALLFLLAGHSLSGCADPEQERARKLEESATQDSEDDATCRAKGGGPGQPAYDDCRKALADARAQEGVIQEQKRRDFDRVLGAGTHDY